MDSHLCNSCIRAMPFGSNNRGRKIDCACGIGESWLGEGDDLYDDYGEFGLPLFPLSVYLSQQQCRDYIWNTLLMNAPTPAPVPKLTTLLGDQSWRHGLFQAILVRGEELWAIQVV
jgi:hypothetical protein